MKGTERTSRDVGGAVGGAMTVFLVFALVAVILLSSTVINAINIKNNVAKTITPAVKNINSNLDNVPQLDRTNLLAGKILTAAQPLSGEAGQIVSATNSINDKVQTIHSSAVSINQSVRGIDGRVLLINANLGSIDGKVNSINGTVNSIHGTVNSIGSDVGAINASVLPINGSVHSINATFTSLLPVVVDIKGASGAPGVGIQGINNRLDEVIAMARPIKADTATILNLAGSINGHAAAIENAKVLQDTGIVSVLGLSSILPKPAAATPAKAAPAATVPTAPLPMPSILPALPLPGLSNLLPALPSSSGLSGALPGVSNLVGTLFQL